MMFAMRFLCLLWTISPQFLAATTEAKKFQKDTIINAMRTERHTHHCVLQNQEVAVLPKYIKIPFEVFQFLLFTLFFEV
jgi:hypothetical protein